jgi:GMP synthase (glutamine-hydrolysing)
MPRVLVIDAVEYEPEEASRKLDGPAGWFGRALRVDPDVEVEVAACSDPRLATRAAAAEGVILSGSPRDAWSDEPEVLDYLGSVRDLMNAGKPLFGVCYGHQVMARAAGGKVAPNPAGWEVGNALVELTAAGRACPLFQAASSSLEVIESHQDAVVEAPPGSTVLATNPHTRIQALSYGPRQFSVQFHPEFTPEILRALWTERRELLRASVPFDLDVALDTVRPTPQVTHLFAQFLDLLSHP